ncbi:glycerol kinase [Actinobacteria bacterium IMCC26207]|nr:glycerol kinase [Actinobacteria bacterium IMCC26207]
MSQSSADNAVILTIDAGTTGVRAFAIDLHGHPVGRSYREFTQSFPQPGWVEHDAAEIWTVTQQVIHELVTELGRTVAAVGITDQRETIVAWSSRTKKPLHAAIVWQDRRTAARCEQLQAQGELPAIRATTGLVLDPYFSASKIEWLLTKGGVTADEDLMLGTIDSWLLWNLTGGAVHLTDPSNASRTMLFDIRSGEWSADLCDLFGVPISALPQVRPSAGVFGTTAASSGLAAGIPITGIAGDQQAALFGQACVHPGMAKNTYGTGSFVLMNLGSTCPEPSEGLLTTVAWTLPERMLGTESGSSGSSSTDGLITHYALEGSIFATGAAVQWLRDGLGIVQEAAEIGPLAESVPDSGGVVFVPAFAGLGSPYWDPFARGTVLGITRGSGRAEFARAVVEAMAYQTRDVVDAMTAASGTQIEELRVDGGASVMPLLLQLQADQLGVTVLRSSVSETTALGASYLAGLGAGIWADLSEVSLQWQAGAQAEPTADRTQADASYSQWQRAVERSRSWASE